MSEPLVKIHDKYFKPYIKAADIQARIEQMGDSLSKRYQGEEVIALGVLNGAFVFMADLIRHCQFDVEVRFITAKSYEGMESSGSITIDKPELLQLRGKHVMLIEDIIDTGFTLQYVISQIMASQPQSLAIITLLQKPSALQYEIEPDEVGFTIPPAFVVGYGLDYDEKGRHLPDIYQLAE
jgi:hypoxanthine phosphoribosyltransferase